MEKNLIASRLVIDGTEYWCTDSYFTINTKMVTISPNFSPNFNIAIGHEGVLKFSLHSFPNIHTFGDWMTDTKTIEIWYPPNYEEGNRYTGRFTNISTDYLKVDYEFYVEDINTIQPIKIDKFRKLIKDAIKREEQESGSA